MFESDSVTINIGSEVFNPQEKRVKVNFNLSFNHHGKEKAENEASKSMADILQISFVSMKKIPPEVEEYVKNNLGSYEISEEVDSGKKTLLFELKINDIESEKILKLYDDFFMKELASSFLDITYERSQSLEDFAEDLKTYFRVPIMYQLLENANLNIKLQGYNRIIEGFVQFLKSQNKIQLANFLQAFECLLYLRSDIKCASYKKQFETESAFLSLDQKDLMKEFFLAFDNVLVKFIFENGQEGILKISGRILDIMNYEFYMEAKNFSVFLHKLRSF